MKSRKKEDMPTAQLKEADFCSRKKKGQKGKYLLVQ